MDRIAESPARLRVGDLMTVPADSDRCGRYHFSDSTLGKMGCSMGYTCRSTNSVDAVRKMFRTGNKRTMYVYSAVADTVSYTEQMNSKYGNLYGNSVASKPAERGPLLRYAELARLPDPAGMCEKELLVACQLWCKSHKKEAVIALRKLGMTDTHVMNLGRSELTADSAVSYAADDDSFIYKRDMKGRTEGMVPILYSYGDRARRIEQDNPISDELAETCMIDDFFDANCNYRASDYVVTVPPKFLVEYGRRGAIYERPDAEFVETVTKLAVGTLLRLYVKGHTELLSRILIFGAALEKGMSHERRRIASSGRMIRKAILTERELKILNGTGKEKTRK